MSKKQTKCELLRRDIVWKSNKLTKSFLTNIRGGIPFASEQNEVMMRLIQASKRPVEAFMDVGCGNGILAGAILRDYPRAIGTLVDFSDAMLSAAKRHLRQSRSQLRFVKADFSSKEWLGAVGGERFDAVVSGYAIHHQPDRRKREIFREVFRLLNPGGVFVNIEHVAPESRWIARLNDDLFVDSLYKYHSRKGQRKTRELILKEFVHRKDKPQIYLLPSRRNVIGFADVVFWM
ncbi:MAG: class I SAM-dependent methyltransferase [Candidatus Bathyarchaeia archaeon]